VSFLHGWDRYWYDALSELMYLFKAKKRPHAPFRLKINKYHCSRNRSRRQNESPKNVLFMEVFHGWDRDDPLSELMSLSRKKIEVKTSAQEFFKGQIHSKQGILVYIE